MNDEKKHDILSIITENHPESIECFSSACINIDIANKFLNNPDTINLASFTRINGDAARALSSYRRDWFDGLSEDEVYAARSLSGLNLNGLVEISDAAALALSNFQADLFLNGLVELSDTAARHLSQHRYGILSLCALNKISDSALIDLLRHYELIFLNGLTELPDGAAQAISQNSGGGIGLGGLTRISDEVALALSQYQGWYLDLSGLTDLSEFAVNALSQYKGTLENGNFKRKD